MDERLAPDYSPFGPLQWLQRESRVCCWEQIHCRNRHGSNRRGKKVSGLAFAETTRLRHHSQRCRGSLRDSAGGGGAAGGAAGLSQAGTACAITVGVGGAVGLMAPVAGVTGGFGDSRLLDGKASSMSAQYSLLATTNDSRLRVYDLDSFAMVSVILSFSFLFAAVCYFIHAVRYIFLLSCLCGLLDSRFNSCTWAGSLTLVFISRKRDISFLPGELAGRLPTTQVQHGACRRRHEARSLGGRIVVQ